MNYEITFNCIKNQHGQSQKMHLFSSMMKLCRNNEFVLFSMQRIIKMWELWEGCHSELYQKIFLVIYNNIIKAFPFVLLFCPKHGVVLFYFLIIIEDDNVQNASLCNAQKFIGEGQIVQFQGKYKHKEEASCSSWGMRSHSSLEPATVIQCFHNSQAPLNFDTQLPSCRELKIPEVGIIWSNLNFGKS